MSVDVKTLRHSCLILRDFVNPGLILSFLFLSLSLSLLSFLSHSLSHLLYSLSELCFISFSFSTIFLVFMRFLQAKIVKPVVFFFVKFFFSTKTWRGNLTPPFRRQNKFVKAIPLFMFSFCHLAKTTIFWKIDTFISFFHETER